MIEKISIQTGNQFEMIPIDHEIQKVVDRSGVKTGICTIYIPHTTAAVTINENADPDVPKDMLKEMNKIVPFDDNYLHAEGNSAAHIKASLFGISETVIISNGRLLFGTWQSLFFCEFDGPRRRNIQVHILEDKSE